MKITFKILLILTAVLLVSCGKDYLDTEMSKFISADQMAEAIDMNPDLQAANITGIYNLMITLGSGGSPADEPDHDDFGQKSYDIMMDMLCGDMKLAGYNYGWYSNIDKMIVTVDYTKIGNYRPWRYYYRIIYSCNLIIESFGGNDAIPEEDNNKAYLGQVKAMRAHSYFYLANLYANEYNPSTPILPLYITPVDVASELKSTEEIYNVIISDLESAVSLLENFDRAAKNEVNKYVAEGLLAYVYLTVGEYGKAHDAAKDVIDNGGFSIIPLDQVTKTGFNSVSSNSWMWGMDLTLENGFDLISFWGQIDLFTYSYAWAGDPKVMDIGLYNSMRSSDKRRNQFIDMDEDGNYWPLGKFYNGARQIGGQREVTDDYVYMRVEEMYLLAAEAAAKNAQDGIAVGYLKSLVEKRDGVPDYVDALSGQDLKDEIYHQWKLELWGEGKSYLAMKRNKATITRTDHLSNNGDFQYNDDRLTYEIPKIEIQNNPFVNK